MGWMFNGLQPLRGRALRASYPGRTPTSVAILGALALMIMAAPGTARKEQPIRKPWQRHLKLKLSAETSTYGKTAQSQEASAQTLPNASPSAQTAPGSLRVSYENGQLTIIAENSLLSDILSEVRARMGADIDLPASASGERIWVRLGPGPPRRILAELLGGTDLNYVIQASDTDVDGIRSVLLTPRSKATAPPRTSTEQLARSANRKIPGVNPNKTEVPAQENAVVPEARAESEAASATPPPAASTDARPVATNLQSTTGTPGSDPSKPLARTTEEMIQQLQSMYQQRKQMQQGQKPSAPN
jgi:hypothetical protein